MCLPSRPSSSLVFFLLPPLGYPSFDSRYAIYSSSSFSFRVRGAEVLETGPLFGPSTSFSRAVCFGFGLFCTGALGGVRIGSGTGSSTLTRLFFFLGDSSCSSVASRLALLGGAEKNTAFRCLRPTRSCLRASLRESCGL